MQLQKDLGEKVRCVSYNVEGDVDDELRSRLDKTLDRQGCEPCVNLISAESYDKSTKPFEIDALPCLVIYQKDGTIREVYEQLVEFDKEVVPLVKLLAK